MMRIAYPCKQFSSNKAIICLLTLVKLMLIVPKAYALEHIEVNGTENGLRLGENFELWHDPTGQTSLADAQMALKNGQYSKLASKGSTGLKPGSFWSHFYLKNTSNHDIELYIEYIDHILISLQAYQSSSNNSSFNKVTDLSLANSFKEREIAHHRFVFSAKLKPNEVSEFFVKYSSDKAGYVFPELRLWSPNNLHKTQYIETAITAFLLGGLFLISLFTLVAGITSKEHLFYLYSIYAFSKLLAWSMILGYAHQFILQDSFHWNQRSLCAAFAIFAGLIFARSFLQTRQYTKKLDYILLLMICNALLLFIFGLLNLTKLSILCITLALLLYPVLPIIGVIRWFQGSKEAIIFSIAWVFLAAGLLMQALRDLGHVEHNFINYYWPPVSSFTEIMVIMIAMGIKIRLFKDEKEIAEKEAHTDVLTGANNRRYFFLHSEALFNKHRNRTKPLSMIMFDIDHFKVINDQHGHAAGDEVLKIFTRFIMGKIREEDIFGRLGGEEFALVISDSDQEATRQMADRLRSEISELKIQYKHISIQITVSIGISHLRNEQNLDELINRADKALYHAKQMGRNRVELAV